MGMTTAVPNLNPTGVIGSGSGNTGGSPGTPFSNFSPGGPGSMNFGNVANPHATPTTSSNPYMSPGAPQASPGPGSSAGGGAAAPGTKTPIGTLPGLGELQNIYGPLGDMIYQYLQSNGGYNGALTGEAVAAQTNASQQQIQLGANNLESTLGAEGVSGGSTDNTQALTNYENTAVTQENAITAQEYYNMWNASQDRELSELQSVQQGAGTYEANKFNWEDALSLVIGGAQAGGTLAEGVGILEGKL